MTIDRVHSAISESIAVKQMILQDEELLQNVLRVTSLCISAFQKGNKVLLAGNGGSAADAQHIATEFVSRFAFDRPGLPAIALTTDTSLLTAIGNDYDNNELFRRQMQAHGAEGDVFIGISTSGNSKNIINALNQARLQNVVSVGLSGETGGDMQSECDICLRVPSRSTPRIQEAHITLGHIICGIVEETLFSRPTTE